MTYMITRRCTQRQFLMRPDPETNNAFIYCLGVAAQRCGIDVLFTVANTNHHHTGIYDRNGNYPAFLEYFHKLFAKCQNTLRGRWENFWSSEQTSVVRLVDASSILDKMTYALTNPVKDDLVEKAHEWPGVTAYDAIVDDQKLTARRPRHFFREDGTIMPEAVSLSFKRPEAFADLSQAEFASLVRENVRRVEESAALDRKSRGVRVLGREGVLKQDWHGFPKGHEQRGGLRPTVATRNKWRRAEALEHNRGFSSSYGAVRPDFLNGRRDVVFPRGTYRLRGFSEGFSPPSPQPTG
jgi:putative transposase